MHKAPATNPFQGESEERGGEDRPSGTQIHPLASRGLHLPQVHNSLYSKPHVSWDIRSYIERRRN
jgi:hypothetical protein